MARPGPVTKRRCCHLQSSRVIFWGILNVLFSLPRFNTPRYTASTEMKAWITSEGSPASLPLQFGPNMRRYPRICCTETQIGDQDCFQRISRFCLPRRAMSTRPKESRKPFAATERESSRLLAKWSTGHCGSPLRSVLLRAMKSQRCVFSQQRNGALTSARRKSP